MNNFCGKEMRYNIAGIYLKENLLGLYSDLEGEKKVCKSLKLLEACYGRSEFTTGFNSLV